MASDPPIGALHELELVAAHHDVQWTALSGGVSSDIWTVDLGHTTICVKRARPELDVAASWHAPVERNESEVAWLKCVAEMEDQWVPRVLGHLPDAHLFVMEYLDPERYPVWKARLMSGNVDELFASEVGVRLGTIHSKTAANNRLAAQFATDDLFEALRLEPYLGATARAHPDLAGQLADLSTRTAKTRLALVHGDVSPKNLLCGPDGPVFLDAECAWFGDPAFDVAFCLTHLLLKCYILPGATAPLLASFQALFDAYLRVVDWEDQADTESRVASLIPALLLARVDGKSPVEYLTGDTPRDAVRTVSRNLIKYPTEHVGDVSNAWEASLSK